MTPDELIEHALGVGMEWAEGQHDGAQGVFLHWPNPNDPDDDECSFIPLADLPHMEWDPLYLTVVHGRNVRHVSRVVGYFSRIGNWNRSKHGELKDRQRGDYGMGSTASRPAGVIMGNCYTGPGPHAD